MKGKFKSLITILLTLSLVISSTLVSFANDTTSEEKIIVTDEIILQMADKFAENMKPDLELIAKNPIKFYNTDDQAIGYIVSYYSGTQEHGYVIFDTTHESLISEYSFDENARTPVETMESRARAASLDNKVYKTAPFTYGRKKSSDPNVLLNNYGEEEKIAVSRSFNKPQNWENIIMDFDDIYENYQIISMNTIPEFIGFEEGSEIEAMTGHYACAVTAMYTCATYYGTVSYSNMKADYMQLWNLSDTFIDKTTSSGIILGLTPNAKQGPALVSFCSSKGKNSDIGIFSLQVIVFYNLY